MRAVFAASALSVLVLGISDPVRAAERTTGGGVPCEALAGQSIPSSAIGLPTSGASITSAMQIIDDAHNGQYCKVLGAIAPVDPAAPPIELEVNLPAQWNGKMLQLGGGGFDGSLVSALMLPGGSRPEDRYPLAQGYVTLGSDSGHKGTPGDASFALNGEALRNFGSDQIKKTHDVAVAIIMKRFGRPAEHSYFIGGSQGGHEALVAVQRFPRDYDGAVSLYPAYNVALLHLGANAFAKALYGNGGAGWLSPNKTALLEDAAYAACDGLDGARDGIISNLAGCERAFTIATVKAKLRCPEGADTGESCLSDAQIATVEKINSALRLDFALPDGQQTFPRWTILEGAKFLQALGASKTPSHPPARTDALQYGISDTSVRFVLTGNPNIDSINAFNPNDYRRHIMVVAPIIDAADADISAFRDRGGKLLLLHGTADELITPYNTIDYYHRLVDKLGAAGLEPFVRFYLVPGYGHGRGIFDARWSPLEVLDAWVTRGTAPGALTAVDGNDGANRSRPLCLYPAWPKYNGTGDINAASSFSCVK